MRKKYIKKLSPATKRLLSAIPEGNQPEINLLIRIDGEFGPKQHAQLEPFVIEFRSVAGDVIALVTSQNSVPKIASLGFVLYIDVSVPMFLEAPPSDEIS